MSQLQAEMMEKIRTGQRLEAPEEMTPEYREHLVHLMTMQADSELAGAYGYVPWICKAPTVEEKHVVAQIVKDELRHATVMYSLLADLGVAVDAHVQAHDETFTMRIDAGADIGTQRISSDKRVNIFYYPIETWPDFVFFNFCMDRGAGHQLEDVRQCSYGPWARAIEGIFKEEKFHIRHGE
jgi:ring-1,2-phenylacetyl-CoA epoxidase subunit PaaA